MTVTSPGKGLIYMHGLLRVIFKQMGPWVEPRQLLGTEVEGGKEGEEKEKGDRGEVREVGGGRGGEGGHMQKGEQMKRGECRERK